MWYTPSLQLLYMNVIYDIDMAGFYSDYSDSETESTHPPLLSGYVGKSFIVSLDMAGFWLMWYSI